MALEKDKQLPFLAVMVKSITDGDLTGTVHRIATTTIGMVHFSSNQLVGFKVSFLRALFNRINGDKCRPKNHNCRRQPYAEVAHDTLHPDCFAGHRTHAGHERYPSRTCTMKDTARPAEATT